ncbi:MAG TPA: ester cyclase [Mycobacteriales bacterium]|nr:ester cyclase [Mycobacteriales bacterium]
MTGESLLEKWFAAGDAGDLEAFDDLLHAEVVVHAPLGLSTEGVAAEKEVWREARHAMPDIRHEIQDVVTDGDLIAARAVVTGSLQHDFAGVVASGQRFRIDQGLFARVQDGRIIEAWEIVDTASLLRQLGAIPD